MDTIASSAVGAPSDFFSEMTGVDGEGVVSAKPTSTEELTKAQNELKSEFQTFVSKSGG